MNFMHYSGKGVSSLVFVATRVVGTASSSAHVVAEMVGDFLLQNL